MGRRRRGVGLTGGHFHDNWGNDNFRQVVLNAMVWLTKAEVPPRGEQLETNLDPKPAR